MNQLYALLVRLSLDVGGIGTAAGVALRAFTGIEGAATRVDRLLGGMRLTMDTRGLTTGAAQAMASFRQLELQGGRMGQVFSNMNLSRGTQPFITSVSQAQTQLSGLERQATAAEARVTALDQTMARATFLNGGAAPTSLSYQWTGMQRSAAANAAVDLRGKAGLAAAGLATSQGALQSHLQTQMAAVNAAAMAEQQRVNQSMGLVAGGAVLTAAGVAGASALKGWVDAASQIQDAMKAVGIATRGTAGDLEHIQQLAYTVSGQTQFSAPDVLTMAQLAATGGINNRGTLASMLPTLARGAEIENRLKGISYQESVPAFVSIAHQFQAYGAQPGMNAQQAAAANTQFQSLIGRVVQAQTVSNLTPTELEHSLAYLTSAHAGLGVTPEQAIEFTAFASNVGLTGGQGGGARLRAFFQRMAGPGVNAKGQPASNAWSQALGDIQTRGGGSFFDAQGQFGGVQNAFAIIAKASASFGSDQRRRLQEMTAAFGAPGSMIATVGSTPEAIARQQQLAQTFAQNPIAFTAQAQAALNATRTGQQITLATNVHNLAAILGGPLLGAVTGVYHGLVLLTGGLVDFLSQHPRIATMIAVLTSAATGMALVVGPLMLLVGAVGLLAPGLGAVMGAATGAIGAVTGLTASIARLGVTSAAAGATTTAGGVAGLGGAAAGAAGTGGIGSLGTLLGGLAGAALPLAGTAAALVAIVGVLQWTGGLSALVTVVRMLGDALGNMGNQLNTTGVGKAIGSLFSGLGTLAHNALTQLQTLWQWIQSHMPHNTPTLPVTPGRSPGIGATTTLPGAGTVGLLPSYPAALGHIPQVTHLAMPSPAAARGAGGAQVTLHPGAVQVHVQTGQVKDQKKLARDIGAMVTNSIGGAIQRQTQHGAIGGAPLVPRASW